MFRNFAHTVAVGAVLTVTERKLKGYNEPHTPEVLAALSHTILCANPPVAGILSAGSAIFGAAQHVLRTGSAITEAQRNDTCDSLVLALQPASGDHIDTHARLRDLLVLAVSSKVDLCCSPSATLGFMEEEECPPALTPLAPQIRSLGTSLRRIMAMHNHAHGHRCRESLIPLAFGVVPPSQRDVA
jgi:hypothetical protein